MCLRPFHISFLNCVAIIHLDIICEMNSTGMKFRYYLSYLTGKNYGSEWLIWIQIQFSDSKFYVLK